MMSEEELTSAGVNTRALHKDYVNHVMNSNDNNPSIVGEFKAQHLHSGPGFFSIAWSDLYDLFNLDVLDISLIPCLTLSIYSIKDCSVILILLCNHLYVIYLKTNIFVCRKLAKQSNECQLGVALIDPEKFTASMIEKNPDRVTTIVLDILKTSPGFVLAAYHTGSHYFLVVICPK